MNNARPTFSRLNQWPPPVQNSDPPVKEIAISELAPLSREYAEVNLASLDDRDFRRLLRKLQAISVASMANGELDPEENEVVAEVVAFIFFRSTEFQCLILWSTFSQGSMKMLFHAHKSLQHYMLNLVTDKHYAKSGGVAQYTSDLGNIRKIRTLNVCLPYMPQLALANYE